MNPELGRQFLEEMGAAAQAAGRPAVGARITLRAASGRWSGEFVGSQFRLDNEDYLTWANEHIEFGMWDVR